MKLPEQQFETSFSLVKTRAEVLVEMVNYRGIVFAARLQGARYFEEVFSAAFLEQHLDFALSEFERELSIRKSE